MRRGILRVLLSSLLILLAGCASLPEGSVGFLPGYARALAWSPDGTRIVGVGMRDLLVHDAATLQLLFKRRLPDATLDMVESPAAVAYAPDGKRIATAAGGAVLLWDASTWESQSALKEPGNATTLAFTPDGSRLVVAGPLSPLAVVELATGAVERILAPAPSGVLSVAVSPDGRFVATGEKSRQVRVWDLASGELAAAVGDYSAPVLSVAYSRDGRFLAATAAGRELRLLDAADLGRAVVLLDPASSTPEEQRAEAVAGFFSLLAAGRTAQLTGAPAPVLVGGAERRSGFTPAINCPLAFSPDGKYLALVHFSVELASSYHVEVFELASGRRISRRHSGISALAFSPDGRQLAASAILSILLIDPLTGNDASAAR